MTTSSAPRRAESAQARWPRLIQGAGASDPMTLDALRLEIDHLDDQMLALFERRLALASRVGRAKGAPDGPHAKLRPDREQAVLDRMTGQASEDTRQAVAGLWREIVGWGLARQGELRVAVWSPTEPALAYDGARRRFGRAAAIRMARSPEAALAQAADGGGVAVLAINHAEPWWIGLRRDWSMLSVFDGFGDGPIPSSLAVGRIDPVALPSGPRVLVQAGGDAGEGRARRRGLHTHHGWTLSLVEAGIRVGEDGCVGAIG